MKNIVLLGSTGSVGMNVLDVARKYPDLFRVKAIASRANTSSLIEQAREFKPDIVAIGDSSRSEDLNSLKEKGIKVLSGQSSLEEMASMKEADIIFMAISGTSALKPLISALEAGKNVALASKEPIVSAGMIITELADKTSATIIPVDSEHSAITQCLQGKKISDVERLYITGSGGALKDRKKEEFSSIRVEEVLNHPTWDMGDKITVDSATLMNKGLEVIEARWLFDVPEDRIKVVMHPEAVIHSMVEFTDGTIAASMFMPDMRFPILRALSYPDVLKSDLPRVDFKKLGSFTFYEPDTEKFPALGLAFRVLKEGGTLPAVLNSANEAAVGLFLKGEIKFNEIIEKVEETVEKHEKKDNPSLEDIIESEEWAKEEVLRVC